mmetsp:Transcript_23020/g.23665  ORF Transcript_23020/g.23665 Transcript_23020/m.23665 type:complete len:107 (+) Transcript_23020:91-411(+)
MENSTKGGQSSFARKWKRLWTEQPLVPIGGITTIGFLFAGLYTMRTGDKVRSQLMMRGRVAAQAVTIVAMLIAYKSFTSPNGQQTISQTPTFPDSNPINTENDNSR